jgi:exopolyphosphatase / guanosine-5'-triphosphate,3'-diphosphate pyrophosphatase
VIRVAAIDCGTNSIRLLIADVDGDVLADVARRMDIVRLGQGVDRTGRLAEPALERTFAALRGYAEQIEQAGAARIRMVATSATRDAENSQEFVAGVKELLGQEPEVVTGAEEAALSYAGATRELAGRPLDPPYLVVDIGGGSTEFILGDGEPRAALSVDIGCVRLTERHLTADPPDPAGVGAAAADVDAALERVRAEVPVEQARTLVGLAGSVTTVGALALGMTSYDPTRTHHARIPAPRVHALAARLLRSSHTERAAEPVIHPGRVDVIAAGALVLSRVVEDFGFADVLVSEHDILDGIAWSIA